VKLNPDQPIRTVCVVCVVSVVTKPGRKTIEFMAEAVRGRELVIPISQRRPLSEAAKAQAEAAKSGIGKIMLLA